MRTISEKKKHKRTRALTPCIEPNGVDGLFIHLNGRMSIHLFIDCIVYHQREADRRQISQQHRPILKYARDSVARLLSSPADRMGAPK